MENKCCLAFGSFILIGVILMSFISAQETGSISGKVIPVEAGIKVRAIQNLSLVAEAVTDENGDYIIAGLELGIYGLLFESSIPGAAGVFVYNDDINNVLGERVGEGNRIIVTLKETINYNASGVNINLYDEWPDYAPNKVIVQFKLGISEKKINEVVNLCGCDIKEKNERSYGTYYVLNFPEDKTVLEVVRDLNPNENVEFAEWEGIVRTGNQTENETGETGDEIQTKEKSLLWVWIIIGIIIFIIVYFIIRKINKNK